jgi:O-antigen/teichoic acid export membrane protein
VSRWDPHGATPAEPVRATLTVADEVPADQFRRARSSAHAVSRGVLWKLSSQTTIQIVGFGVSVAVARLLVPSQYGAASLTLALAAFAVVFSDVTLGSVLVQRQAIGQDEASSLMWFSLALGVALAAVFAALAHELATLVGDQQIEPLLYGVAPVFAISTLGTVPTALLNRRMAFRVLELRRITATVMGSLSALFIALAGGGAWALVGQTLVQTSLLTGLAWVSARWRPNLTLSRRHLGGIAPSGLYVAGSRVLSTMGANVDTLLVGRYVGTAALGAYAIAYNILLIPLTRLAGPIREVAFPTFSSLDDRVAVGRMWFRANAVLFAILAPVLVALIVEADDFVRVVLGPHWGGAGEVLRLLAIGGFLQLPMQLVSSVLQACGQQRVLFALSWATTGALLVGFVVGLHWGIVGVAAGYAAANLVAIPLEITPALRSTEASLSSLLRSMRPLLTACALMIVAMVAVRQGLRLEPLARLFVSPACGLAVFIGVLVLCAGELKADLSMLAATVRSTNRA